jgi:hypothetical protein
VSRFDWLSFEGMSDRLLLDGPEHRSVGAEKAVGVPGSDFSLLLLQWIISICPAWMFMDVKSCITHLQVSSNPSISARDRCSEG